MSLATLLSQSNETISFDIDKDRIKKINNWVSPVFDNEIQSYFKNKQLNLKATDCKNFAYKDSELIIIATPTDYDSNLNLFDTSSVESVIKDILEINTKCSIVIKSTVPVGFTEEMRIRFSYDDIIFSPEFLREGKSLYDNLYPSRVVVGGENEKAKQFAKLLEQNALKKDVKILLMKSSEAEAVKLFSNTYLAMRISFFNELDSYTISKKLNTIDIIDGVCADNRIGNYYNNPSFGYGGYCLPKDTKQLLSNFSDTPQNLMDATVKSNSTRKDFIVNDILKLNPTVVGIFRLIMKEGSDNFRSSAIKGIMRRIKKKGIKIIIYEPGINDANFLNLEIIRDLDDFKKKSDIILANRVTSQLNDVLNKVYSRDIFNRD
jgi:UDPglucose 6-dehydrogenase